MAKIWILAANGSQAKLFTADSPIGPLTELESLENPDARAKQRELTSDRPGRSFDSQGEGRHAMAVEVDSKEQEQIRFARLVADRLEQARLDNQFERLVIIAAPAFLGLLRTSFNTVLNSLLSLEIDKDYTTLRADELRKRLPERI